MAGQKLSSRQKMINMMYLVLTALLALNVSSEILQAFEALRKSLAESTHNFSMSNGALALGINKAIDQQVANGETSKAPLKDKVENITKQTEGAVQYLDLLTDELEKIAEYDANTGELKAKDEQEENYRFWLGTDDLANGGRGNGKALEMRNKLEEYVKWANQAYAELHPEDKTHFAKLIMEPSEDKSISDPEARNKTWEYHTFHGKPVVADLAMVEKFKMDLCAVETGLLNLVKEQLQDVALVVDTLMAMEAPMAQVVAAGMQFQTRLFVGMGSKEVKPEFMGGGIKVEPGGNSAMMTLMANGSVIPEGQTEGVQSYQTTIKIKKRDGTYMELPLKGSFKVRKPEVVVRSKQVQVLYKDCSNTVTVDVPALGDSYNPDFSRSTGGTYKPSTKSKTEVTLIPTAKQFVLSVHSNTNGQNIKIDNIKYEVVPPPVPKLKMFVGATMKEYDGKSEIPKRDKITLKLFADEDFKSRYPDDVKYKVSSAKLMYKEGLGTATTIDTKTGSIMNGIVFDLGSYSQLRQAPPGARIYVEVDEVKRVNFLGKDCPENTMSIYVRTIAAVLR